MLFEVIQITQKNGSVWFPLNTDPTNGEIFSILKKNGFHIIEGIISFIQLHDLILIKKHNKGQHEVSFYGKFSNGIPKKNSIVSLLNLLEKKQKLYGNKFEIKIIFK